MTPLGVKTCKESEFDIFEAKKRFLDSGKACVLCIEAKKFFSNFSAIMKWICSKHSPDYLLFI
jgi:hypothetical protein